MAESHKDQADQEDFSPYKEENLRYEGLRARLVIMAIGASDGWGSNLPVLGVKRKVANRRKGVVRQAVAP